MRLNLMFFRVVHSSNYMLNVITWNVLVVVFVKYLDELQFVGMPCFLVTQMNTLQHQYFNWEKWFGSVTDQMSQHFPLLLCHTDLRASTASLFNYKGFKNNAVVLRALLSYAKNGLISDSLVFVTAPDSPLLNSLEHQYWNL